MRLTLSTCIRAFLYFLLLGLGFMLLRSYYDDTRYLFGPSLGDSLVFAVLLAAFMLTLPLMAFNCVVHSLGVTNPLADTDKEQAEMLYSNAVHLLFEPGNNVANSRGLRALMKLRQSRSIAASRIDIVTSSNLEIIGAYLDKIHFEGADLEQANFKGGYLVESNLAGANLTGAHLEEANLSGAHLAGACLEGANLAGANLEKVILQGAKYNKKTVFPDGFNPDSFGMILSD